MDPVGSLIDSNPPPPHIQFPSSRRPLAYPPPPLLPTPRPPLALMPPLPAPPPFSLTPPPHFDSQEFI
jgi:hypothetical protein